MTLFIRSCLLLSLAAVVSCGGGGGSDGGGGSPSPNPGAFTVSVDRNNVTFDFVQGANPTQQVLNATWTGTPPAQVFVGATLTGTGLNQTIPIAIGQTSATITLTAATGLLGGTYTGTVNLLVCSDAACNQRIGGTPIPVNFTVNVRTPVFTGPVNIGFTYTRGTTPQATPVPLNVVAGAGAWTASVDNPFITLSKTSGTGADTVNVFFNPSALASGNYTGRVTLTGANGTQSVPVQLTLTTPTITPIIPGGLPSFEFSGINGRPFAPMQITLNIDTPGPMPLSVSSNQPWATVSNVSANAPGQFTLTLNPAVGPLASSVPHTGTLRVEVGNGNFNLIRDFPLGFSLTAPTLSVSTPIVVGGPLGRDFDQIPVSVDLNTGSNAYAWTVTGVPPWLDFNRTSGNASATPDQILVEPLRLQSTPGTATATLTFTAQVNGDTVTATVPASFNLDTHRLIAAENGVALVSTPSPTWRRLTRTVRIRSNLGFTTPWTATVQGNPAWLNLTTAAGVNGGNLVMQADPVAAGNGLHLTTIVITSSDTSVDGPERIQVGFYVRASTPAAVTQTEFAGATNFNAIAADPIRPYVYAHATSSNSIRVFNLYDGVEGTPISPVSTDTSNLAVSSDGGTLYALDRTNETITQVNLVTGVAGTPFPAPQGNLGVPHTLVKYIRPNGVGILATDGGKAFLASNGADVGTGFFGGFDYAPDLGSVFADTSRRDVDFTRAGSSANGTFVNEDAGSVDLGFLDIVRDVATVRDGSRVYVAGSTTPYTFRSFNGVTMTQRAAVGAGVSFPNNTEISSDGRLFTASNGSDSNGRDVWVYNTGETEIATFDITPFADARSLVVSGDGFIGAAIPIANVDSGVTVMYVGP